MAFQQYHRDEPNRRRVRQLYSLVLGIAITSATTASSRVTLALQIESTTIATATPEVFCDTTGSMLTLELFGASGQVISWYAGAADIAAGGVFLGSGNPLTIVQPSFETTYYACASSDPVGPMCSEVAVDVTLGSMLASTNSWSPITNGSSLDPAISADGTVVAFYSSASNLVVDDTNSVVDAFVYDLQRRILTRVSVSSEGLEGNGPSIPTSLSADGQFVAMWSAASNLVPDDMNGARDIFLYDRRHATTILISRSAGGIPANGDSTDARVSHDGRYVAFRSFATNLVADDSNTASDIFLYDSLLGKIERVSVSSGGSQANGGSLNPSISSTGRFVAFHSVASNLVPDDSNSAPDVFVHDRQSKQTTRVSVNNLGVEGDSFSVEPSISGDGICVAYRSAATNLVVGDTNEYVDIFVHDRAKSVTTRVSVGPDGQQADSDAGWVPTISSDGRYIAFWSQATTLVAGDTNAVEDVFVHDRITGETFRASVGALGTEANNVSAEPSISANGRYVAFWSGASNLVPKDLNDDGDVFVRDLWSVDNDGSGEFDRCEQLLGDMNCDAIVSVGDIRGFVLALSDPGDFVQSYPLCRRSSADINQDGVVSVGDISGFIDILLRL